MFELFNIVYDPNDRGPSGVFGMDKFRTPFKGSKRHSSQTYQSRRAGRRNRGKRRGSASDQHSDQHQDFTERLQREANLALGVEEVKGESERRIIRARRRF
ncbi:MAG: hypothetical protein ACOC4K_00790 [Verrucomicrobiota bacterium]